MKFLAAPDCVLNEVIAVSEQDLQVITDGPEETSA